MKVFKLTTLLTLAAALTFARPLPAKWPFSIHHNKTSDRLTAANKTAKKEHKIQAAKTTKTPPKPKKESSSSSAAQH